MTAVISVLLLVSILFSVSVSVANDSKLLSFADVKGRVGWTGETSRNKLRGVVLVKRTRVDRMIMARQGRHWVATRVCLDNRFWEFFLMQG